MSIGVFMIEQCVAKEANESSTRAGDFVATNFFCYDCLALRALHVLLSLQELLERVDFVIVFSLPGHELVTGQVLMKGRDIASDTLGGAAFNTIKLDVRIFNDSVPRAIWLGTNNSVLLLGSDPLLGHPELLHVLVVEDDLGVDLCQGLGATDLKTWDLAGPVDAGHDVIAGTCPAA